MNYIKQNTKFFIPVFFLTLTFNLYFIYLIPHNDRFYIFYIDFLIFITISFYVLFDARRYQARTSLIKELLKQDELIYLQIDDLVQKEILEHDVRIIQQQLNTQFQMNCDLQDYITKWCHEVKLPLSALLLMNEKNNQPQLRSSITEQLEKIRQHLNSAMIGCKVQSSIYDLQVKSISLQEMIKSSIKNNRYFLIQKKFAINLDHYDVIVYTDPQWFIYVLDQLISNTIKYCENKPRLNIHIKKCDTCIQLSIKDNGVGIKESDLANIFDRGFVGSNHHNGEYKATGMGLYLVKEILKRLDHSIEVTSEYGSCTNFVITFKDNREFFHL